MIFMAVAATPRGEVEKQKSNVANFAVKSFPPLFLAVIAHICACRCFSSHLIALLPSCSDCVVILQIVHRSFGAL